MTPTAYQEKLKREFIEQATSVFERVMAEEESGEALTLSQIEEKVGALRFELTSKLVASKLKLAVKKSARPSRKMRRLWPRNERQGAKKTNPYHQSRRGRA